MCSLIGFKTKTPANHQNKVEQYLKILEERGDQSFGYFYITADGSIFYAKSLALKPLLDDIKGMPANSWCFIHARKASYGMAGTTVAEKLSRAHPVTSDDDSILLLHNGTKASIKDTVYGSLSDSQGLATLLSTMWEGRNILAGDLGVVIYERKGKIYLYKDGVRPLVMSEDKTIFASEPVFDTVKWQNIGVTTGGTAENSFDIELDFTKSDLGLTLGAPVEIKFNIALTTIKNYSTMGMPRVSLCTTCKRKHIDLLNNYRICCTCAIEERLPAVYANVPTATKPATPPATTTAQVTNSIHKTPTTPTVQGVVPINKGGILERSSNSVPSSDEIEIFTSDINILKTLGYDSVTWRGWAIVKVNMLYKNTDGVFFAEPVENGHHKVKVDRIFVKRNNPIFKSNFSTITNKAVHILGDLDNKGVSVLRKSIDISIGFRDGDAGAYALDTHVVPRFYVSPGMSNKGVLVGFRALEL